MVPFVWVFRLKLCMHFSFPDGCYMNHPLIFFYLIAWIIFGDEYKLYNSSLYNFLGLYYLFVVSSKYFLQQSICKCSQFLSFPYRVRAQVSQSKLKFYIFWHLGFWVGYEKATRFWTVLSCWTVQYSRRLFSFMLWFSCILVTRHNKYTAIKSAHSILAEVKETRIG
jgi:hypothetical protein